MLELLKGGEFKDKVLVQKGSGGGEAVRCNTQKGLERASGLCGTCLLSEESFSLTSTLASLFHLLRFQIFTHYLLFFLLFIIIAICELHLPH